MFRRRTKYIPPPPKPMIARFTVYMREGELTYSEEYDGNEWFSRPEPIIFNGMVRVGDHWINLDEIEIIDLEYEDKLE